MVRKIFFGGTPKYLLIIVFTFLSLLAKTQNYSGFNTTAVNKIYKDSSEHVHSPRKATIYSVCVPGLGQIYNKKYWKLPLVYGGLGASIYFATDFYSKYKDYKNAYLFRIDDDPLTIDSYSDYSDNYLRTNMDNYRRYFEISIFAAVIVYGLNIIDATVDAHFYDFEISDDLSMKIQPVVYNNCSMNYKLVGGLKINFKF